MMSTTIFDIAEAAGVKRALERSVLLKEPETSPDKIRIRLTDNPATYKGLFIDIHKLEVCGSVQGWRELDPLVNRVDVLTLTNGRDVVLGEFEPDKDAGEKILQVNIKLGKDNCLVAEKTANRHLTVGDHRKARERHELRMFSSRICPVNINHEVVVDQKDDIILDMDVAKSILRVDGSFYLRPVIKHLADPYTGIRGRFPGDTRVLVYATDFIRIYSTYTDIYGNFLIRGMASGEYSLMACLPRNNSMAVDGKCIYTANGFVVEGVITELGEWRWE